MWSTHGNAGISRYRIFRPSLITCTCNKMMVV